MKPEEFNKKMEELYNNRGGDIEAFHSDADSLMCELLTSLGYEKGIKIFEDADKWYA